MPSLGVRLLLAANRLLPAPRLPDETDPMEYAAWEYRTADTLVDAYAACPPSPVARALDVGCGLGGKTLRLREHTGAAVAWTGLDVDADHLRHARRFCRERGHDDIRFVRADAAALPFASASFDRIVSADALEHLPAPRQTLRELRRCLRPDGRLVLLFNPWGSPRGSHLGELLRLPWCQLSFDRATLEEAALCEAERRARRANDGRAEEHRRQGIALVDHFRHHVHPTQIADLRRWVAEDGEFALEEEWRIAPGPLGRLGIRPPRWAEEWGSATYAARLRPIKASINDSMRATQCSSA